MTAQEERRQLLDAQQEMMTELRKIAGPVNAIAARMVAAADALATQALDEVQSRDTPIVRKLRVRSALSDPGPMVETKRKRRMKPLSEEAKQKRRESLVKARAARGRK